MKPAAILLLMILAAGPTRPSVLQQAAQPAPAEPQITAEEVKQALDLAESFTAQMRVSRDVAALLKGMFAEKFRRVLTQDAAWANLVGLGAAEVEGLSGEERLEVYRTAFNLAYLSRFYQAAQRLEALGQIDLEDALPPTVVAFLKGQEQSFAPVKTPAQARLMLGIKAQAVGLLKEYLVKHPPEEAAPFKQNLEAFKGHLADSHNALGKPVVRVAPSEQFGYPAGTRFISLEVPFHVGLLMVKEQSRLRLLLAFTSIPSD